MKPRAMDRTVAREIATATLMVILWIALSCALTGLVIELTDWL